MTRYWTSDLHLGHENIIEYCNRPFNSVEEMNSVLVRNWNDRVAPEDTVVFVGDLGRPTSDWLDYLQGVIVFVLGNHDGIMARGHYETRVGDTPVWCVHDPADAPSDWDGWVVHGHHHNNHPDEYPLVNDEDRRVNISVELTEYAPVREDELHELIEGNDVW